MNNKKSIKKNERKKKDNKKMITHKKKSVKFAKSVKNKRGRQKKSKKCKTEKISKSCVYWLRHKRRTCKYNSLTNKRVCKRHRDKNAFDRPDECPVCYETFNDKDYPLRDCGHWIHINCVFKSCDIRCPMCRQEICLTPAQQIKFNKYINKNQDELNVLGNEINVLRNNDDINNFFQELLTPPFTNLLQMIISNES